MQKIKMGILDFGYRAKSASGIKILTDVFEYSSLADELGFFCYWLSEHHNSGQAWSNPEMLIPLLAGRTNKISIGLAGILLAAHSPYRIALNFKLLESIFPGRIDLGLANAPTHLHIVQKLLSNITLDNTYRESFDSKVNELLKYLGNADELLRSEKLLIPPFHGANPRIWKLSNSFNGIEECLQKKMNLCKSVFHSNEPDVFERDRIVDFRERYILKNKTAPKITIAFSGICEKDSKNARRTFNNLGLRNSQNSTKYMVGCPALFKDRILEIKEKSSINEFIFCDQSLSFKKRMETLLLLSREFELN
ncbi:LLM class flavin-dependent oxidoreductase [Mucilaginibacter sp.]|uniref:LLM class flavin-dependent oxidoreductase n=1 Tax=Mucilaginibacter sp. TaxID=1882438 RepID=UPI00260EDE35|nr:LLM class flavin-dependent oxidoreductase [Mucilaginibacter sp.]MDB4926553.1 hypothetical protein [Mucilaginibacter sp.]